ncbi:COP9 signalosome complex subunit 5a [Allomyces arbusculus]|nr:COP9 signalosome complex subunit 5a [Allomyces arbusculus]
MASSSTDASNALKTWLLENNVQTVEPTDELYERTPLPEGRPWTKDPRYFKKVKMSAIALIKMVLHARRGGHLEVMGLMQGKVMGDTMVVLDAFALPVEGTETRVNAQQEAFEFMVRYQQTSESLARVENVVGWYHSHPGYGCWLSGIDVSTQMTNQQYQEPFLAVVVDPNRTISAGRVEIGAFRTYPAGYTPPDAAKSEYQSIPLSKIEDFGVHANQYYQLDVSLFKSRLDAQLLDLLWNKHWVNTLAQSPLTSNKDYFVGQMGDIAAKLDRAESQVQQTGGSPGKKGDDDADASHLGKAARDATKLVSETTHALMSQVIKHVVFNAGANGAAGGAVPAVAP